MTIEGSVSPADNIRASSRDNDNVFVYKHLSVEMIADRILVKSIPVSSKTVGGIELPDSAKERPCRGVVLAVGPGKLTDQGQRVPLQVQSGQVIHFGRYAGTTITLGDPPEQPEDFVVMQEHEMFLIDHSAGNKF